MVTDLEQDRKVLANLLGLDWSYSLEQGTVTASKKFPTHPARAPIG